MCRPRERRTDPPTDHPRDPPSARPQIVRKVFKQLDLDVSEAKGLFQLLDTDRTGEIDADEFISGCCRLRGPAKALDLNLLKMQNRLQHEKFTRRALSTAGPNGPRSGSTKFEPILTESGRHLMESSDTRPNPGLLRPIPAGDTPCGLGGRFSDPWGACVCSLSLSRPVVDSGTRSICSVRIGTSIGRRRAQNRRRRDGASPHSEP